MAAGAWRLREGRRLLRKGLPGGNDLEIDEMTSEWKRAIKVHVISWTICLLAVQTQGMTGSATATVVTLMVLATIILLFNALTSALNVTKPRAGSGISDPFKREHICGADARQVPDTCECFARL